MWYYGYRDKSLWRDRKRYSTRQKRNLYGRVVGDVKIEGDLTELYPYIVLGQHLHVEKNSTFGLGKYEVFIDWRKVGPWQFY